SVYTGAFVERDSRRSSRLAHPRASPRRSRRYRRRARRRRRPRAHVERHGRQPHRRFRRRRRRAGAVRLSRARGEAGIGIGPGRATRNQARGRRDSDRARSHHRRFARRRGRDHAAGGGLQRGLPGIFSPPPGRGHRRHLRRGGRNQRDAGAGSARDRSAVSGKMKIIAGWSWLLAAIVSIAAAPSARGAGAPQRIVSLAPSVTETIFALGFGDRLVGVTTYCDYPAAARRLPKIGSFTSPSLEAILARRPDLVIGVSSATDPAAAREIERLGLKLRLIS